VPVTAAQPLSNHQFALSQKLPRINSPASGLRLETRKILLAHRRSLVSFIFAPFRRLHSRFINITSEPNSRGGNFRSYSNPP